MYAAIPYACIEHCLQHTHLSKHRVKSKQRELGSEACKPAIGSRLAHACRTPSVRKQKLSSVQSLIPLKCALALTHRRKLLLRLFCSGLICQFNGRKAVVSGRERRRHRTTRDFSRHFCDSALSISSK